MKSHLQKGELGEKIALDFLRRQGYQILETNYRYKRSEIDIIAMHQAVLVFIEVKARSNIQFGYPESAVDHHKMEMILKVADHYIERMAWNNEIRFDIIAIVLDQPPEIEHLKDAF